MDSLYDTDSKRRARDDARVVLRAVVCRITNKVSAAATGLSEGHISKALGDKPDDRYLHDHHVDCILALATPAEIVAYWTARMGAYGLKAGPVKPLTADEHLARLRYRIAAKLGPAGAAVVEDEENDA